MKLQNSIVPGVVCLCMFAASSRSANAQTVANSFGQLMGTVLNGTTVEVTDDAGRKVRGRIGELSASSLKLLVGAGQETLSENQVRQITERRRSTGSWAVKGLLVGAGFGLVSALNESCTGCSSSDNAGLTVGAVLGGAMLGAGIGALAGAAHTHKRLVYRAPNPHSATRFNLAPFVSNHGTGFAASLRF